MSLSFAEIMHPALTANLAILQLLGTRLHQSDIDPRIPEAIPGTLASRTLSWCPKVGSQKGPWGKRCFESCFEIPEYVYIYIYIHRSLQKLCIPIVLQAPMGSPSGLCRIATRSDKGTFLQRSEASAWSESANRWASLTGPK